MGKFRSKASKETTISALMDGRTKIKTADLIHDYPGGVTIVGFDLVPGEKGPYPIFIIQEDDKIFFAGGVVLQNIVGSWMEDYGTDIEQANADLKAEGGVKIKMEQGTTKAGRSITTVTVL